MLTKLIEKIRSIIYPERYCPCVICYNERKGSIQNQLQEREAPGA